jgi:hypothetical protein
MWMIVEIEEKLLHQISSQTKRDLATAGSKEQE